MTREEENKTDWTGGKENKDRGEESSEQNEAEAKGEEEEGKEHGGGGGGGGSREVVSSTQVEPQITVTQAEERVDPCQSPTASNPIKPVTYRKKSHTWERCKGQRRTQTSVRQSDVLYSLSLFYVIITVLILNFCM